MTQEQLDYMQKYIFTRDKILQYIANTDGLTLETHFYFIRGGYNWEQVHEKEFNLYDKLKFYTEECDKDIFYILNTHPHISVRGLEEIISIVVENKELK